ncbi:Galactokinase [Violaceomyces palustris]|uniref:Galactokinase n=1 Tax=Violaceomyces palustris TaxID=1673888 RepID=A0ACD0NLI4_9BASI|nr:Galactokinase [Violaceomyces palustris]
MPVSDPVPLVSSLSDIYSPAGVAKSALRWDRLASQFSKAFNQSQPDFIARAPGRVNLIGEHIDYVGFSVFPAAIEKDILMAVKVHRSDDDGHSAAEGELEVVIKNTTPRFEAHTFTSGYLETDQVGLLDQGDQRWANYFKVAFKGLHSHLPAEVLESRSRPTRIEVLVDGTIPPESSLSSSAAMTTCSSIVILQAFGARERIDRTEMAEVAIESERLVGVNSGGMDQSASIFSIPHHALYISFYPKLSVQPTRLPTSQPEHTFVIANTLVVSDKKVTGPVNYNLRVVETRMAARALAKALGIESNRGEETKTLRLVLETFFREKPAALEEEGGAEVLDTLRGYGEEAARLRFMELASDRLLEKGGMTREQVEVATGFRGKDFDQEFLSSFPIRAEKFKLHARSVHVFSEALRVIQFKSLCSEESKGPSTYASLGELMSSSQASLRELYECSCPELDELIQLASDSGAIGSRLTGAGWGGCTVHLVRKSDVPEFLASLRRGYYEKRFPGLREEEINDALFDTEPAGGACVYQV